MRGVMSGIHTADLLETANRVVHMSQSFQRDGAMKMRRQVTGVGGQGSIKMGDRRDLIALGRRYHPEIMKHRRMVRLQSEDIPVYLGRVVQFPRAVEFNRLLGKAPYVG